MNLKMVRVDYRLVHGQIVAKWIKFRPVDRLVVVDEELLKDEFMADIYRMAAPGYQVDIIGIDAIDETLNAKDDDVLLIFKDVKSAYEAINNGLIVPNLNIGAVPSNKDRKSVVQGVALSEEEYQHLIELQDNGTEVFFQPIPESESVSLDSVKNKFK